MTPRRISTHRLPSPMPAPRRYERALTLLALAELHIATDKRADAQVLLDEVRAICTPLGAKPALARADILAAKPDRDKTHARLSRWPLRAGSRGAAARRRWAHKRTGRRTSLPQPAHDQLHLTAIYNKLGVPSRSRRHPLRPRTRPRADPCPPPSGIVDLITPAPERPAGESVGLAMCRRPAPPRVGSVERSRGRSTKEHRDGSEHDGDAGRGHDGPGRGEAGRGRTPTDRGFSVWWRRSSSLLMIGGVALHDRQASHPAAPAIPRAVTSAAGAVPGEQHDEPPECRRSGESARMSRPAQQRFIEGNTTTLPGAVAANMASPIMTQEQQRFWEVNTMLAEGLSSPYAEDMTPLPGHPR